MSGETRRNVVRLTLLVYLISMTGLNSQVFADELVGSSGAPKVDEPLPENVIWGNLVKDAKVDLKDLNRLAINWNKTQELYKKKNVVLLNQLANNWQKEVPQVLNDINWENRTLFTSVDLGSSKADEPLSIGRGIRYTDLVTKEVGLPLYPFTRAQLVKVDTGLGTGDERYDAPDSALFFSKYIDSYATNIDMLGLDINAEAKYVAFKGSFSASYDRLAYRSNKKHEFIVKQVIDYGWWELPSSQIVLNPGVLDKLKGPDNGYKNYGTHYIWAERRKAEASVKILMETSVAEDKVTFGANLSTHFKGTNFSASLAAQISSLKQSFSSISTVTIQIETKGGPQLKLTIDGDNNAAVAGIPDTMTQWSNGVTADNATITEWAARPVTDFVTSDGQGLIGRDVQMNRWFRKYTAVDSVLLELDAIIDRTEVDPTTGEIKPRFRKYYRYFEEATVPANLGHASWETYFYDTFKWYVAIEEELREEGRKLYTDDKAEFIANKWPLREVRKPNLAMVFTNNVYQSAHGGQHNQTLTHQNVMVQILGGNFNSDNGYLLRAPVLCGSPTSTNGFESAGVRPPLQGTLPYDPSSNTTNCIIFSADSFGGNSPPNSGGPCFDDMQGVTLEIRDIFDNNRLVYYQCAHPLCAGVSRPQIQEPPFELSKSVGLSSDAPEDKGGNQK